MHCSQGGLPVAISSTVQPTDLQEKGDEKQRQAFDKPRIDEGGGGSEREASDKHTCEVPRPVHTYACAGAPYVSSHTVALLLDHFRGLSARAGGGGTTSRFSSELWWRPPQRLTLKPIQTE